MAGVTLDGLKRHLRLFDIIVGLVGLVVVLVGLDRLSRTADEYFTVNAVEISDHVEKNNGQVIYDRDIKRPFFGSWQAEIKSIEGARVVCTARGTHNYHVDELISERNMDWYLERTCDLKPGMYLITTEWNLDINCWRKGCNIVRNTSNVFTVWSAEEYERWQEEGRGRGLGLGPRIIPFDLP